MEIVVKKIGPEHDIHLAVFDEEWNSIADINVTELEMGSFAQGGRPSVILHDGHAYISYDISTISPEDFGIYMEENQDWECLVSEYEIVQ